MRTWGPEDSGDSEVNDPLRFYMVHIIALESKQCSMNFPHAPIKAPAQAPSESQF